MAQRESAADFFQVGTSFNLATGNKRPERQVIIRYPAIKSMGKSANEATSHARHKPPSTDCSANGSREIVHPLPHEALAEEMTNQQLTLSTTIKIRSTIRVK